MCGILGVLNPRDQDRVKFQGALDVIAHRGPDGEGRFEDDQVILGHRRLAIIDLSHDGDQPMVDAKTGVTIVFNGEIYNYIEVRDELAALGVEFRSDSDTEVLMRAYIRWGADMLPRLNGMWSLAIWDPRSATMVVSRDRFGVKPFYYACIDGRFVFGSEPKALFKLDPSLAEANARGVFDLFATSEMHAADHTFYQRVKSLPAASWGTVKAGAQDVAIHTYWTYPAAGEGKGADKDFDFEAVFEDAVALRLRSDVPVGLTLSGGLDSSAILAASKEVSGRPLRCFTSVYSADSRGEERWARIAAGIVDAPLASVESGTDQWQATLEKAIQHMDAPGYSPAIVPLWAIMKQARAESVPVLLEGQGADELLGGYSRYSLALLSQMAGDRASWGRLPSEFSTLTKSFGMKWLVLWSLRQAMPWTHQMWAQMRGGNALVRNDVLTTFRKLAPGSGDDGGGLFDMLHRDHSRKILPALLHYGDAVSMAHGIESRLPFMDYRLVEQVFSKRPRLIVEGKTKAPIRDYLNHHGFSVIADRLDKQGYPTPVRVWLAGDGRDFIRDTLADPNDETWTYLKPSSVSAMLDKGIKGDVTAVF